MNKYKVTFETSLPPSFTIREYWRIEANTKDEANERVLSVHTTSKIISTRKMPTKLGLVT